MASRITTRRWLLAAAIAFCVPTLASAQTKLPDTENGRYALSATPDGVVVRLDTRSGAVSTCSDRGNGWACVATPDERAALDLEIGRLQTENQKLMRELGERDARVAGKSDDALPKEPVPKQDSLRPRAETPNKIEIPLPSDQDINRAVTFLERAWRRLIEMADRIHRDATGKI